MDMVAISDFLNFSALAIDAVGIIILLYGCALTAIQVFLLEVSKGTFEDMEKRKRTLIQRIILALDFFVAADLLKLVVAIGLTEIYSLALIVGIRTVLNWSLSKDINNKQDDKS
jgi:uncharacterized membrane protein